MRVTIDSVEQRDGHWFVAQTHTDDDGSTRRHMYVFPLDTLEWRAAEYGIPHTDTATLLDIVMAEPHMREQDWATGHQLHSAPDIATARKDHLARVAAVKLRHRIGTRGKGNPLARVEQESPIHPEVIAVKAEHVAQARQHHQEQVRLAQQAMGTTAAPTGEERAAAIRQQLGLGRESGAA